jgi:hypothetical protein
MGRRSPLSETPGNLLLQRKCACGGSATSAGECEECKKKGNALSRQAKNGSAMATSGVPSVVHDVLNSTGQLLPSATRKFFEPRLGHAARGMQAGPPVPSTSEISVTQPGDRYEKEADRFADAALRPEAAHSKASGSPVYDLSRIRIHTDQSAAEAAAAVNAHAFAVGHHLVFGTGSFNTGSASGLRLIAHELAHTMQQSSKLARQARGPCYGPDVCTDLLTPSKLLAQAHANPENQKKRDDRQQACRKTPPDPSCSANGHGAPATQAEKLLRASDASRTLPGVKVIVDKDMESDFGALTISCDQFMPPITGATTCITIPDRMEQEATQFNTTMAPTIAGKERGLWRERTLEILTHEAEHARFRAARKAGTLLAREPACANQDTRSAMSELVAMLSEFPLRLERVRTSVGLSPDDRKKELDEWRAHRITGKTQSISVSLYTVGCVCNCADSDKLVKETVDFATSSWTKQQKDDLNQEINDPKWSSLRLRWPYAAPAAPSVKTP